MLLHLLRISFRNMRKQWLYSLINVAGLGIGLATFLIVLAYVLYEHSFDRFHEDNQQLFRVLTEYRHKDGNQISEQGTAALGPLMAETLPGISRMCRTGMEQSGFVAQQDQIFPLNRMVYADSVFFDIFSFQLLRGDKAAVLKGIRKMVLTETAARNIFGKNDPLGQSLLVNGRESFVVSGIAADPPVNSSIRFDALLSFETLYLDKKLHMDLNGGNQYFSWIATGAGVKAQALENGFQAILDAGFNKKLEGTGFSMGIVLQKMKDVHLHSPSSGSGQASSLNILLLIATFVLLIAAFNFTNLATATGMKRAMEVSIKKTIGASRSELVMQFLGESLLHSLLALLIALLLSELMFPAFNALLGTDLSLLHGNPLLLWLILPVILATTLLSGAYPAFFLASLRPVAILKGGAPGSKRFRQLSGILIVLQFMIAAFFINSSLVAHQQLRFIRGFDKGFSTGRLFAIAMPDGETAAMMQAFKTRLNSLPAVVCCGAVSEIPGGGLTMNGYVPEGHFQPVMVHVLDTDTSFVNVLGLNLLQGVLPHPGADREIMVNETFVKTFGYDDPVGKKVRRDKDYVITAVLSDFHFAPLHQPLQPLIITQDPYDGYPWLLVRLNQDVDAAALIAESWKQFYPAQPMVVLPVEAWLETSYTEENRLGWLVWVVTLLALLIAATGLFGMAALNLRQRSKELGVRKILGATGLQLLVAATSGFSRKVLLANVLIAGPLWLVLNEWLSYFSYHISISPLVFAATALTTWLIAMLSMGFQAWRSTRIELSKVVKYE